ncbi:MAG: cupin domain-containing protein [Bacteroidota bacterium]
MKKTEEYINSGILEMYVLGLTSDAENIEITKLVASNSEIKMEVEAIETSIMAYANSEAVEINTSVKPLIIATIDYTERLKNGESPTFPPVLNENSKVSDYAAWLDRSDMVSPETFDDIYIKLIGHEPKVISAIVWIKDFAENEIHDDLFEKFLIVEGSCDIIMEKETVSLQAGDVLTIPLHMGHMVKVTSKIPCKIVLQRVAA